MKKKIIAVALGALIMSGCKTTDINPLAEPEEYQPVDSESVTYIAPKNYLNINNGFNGVTFLTYEQTMGNEQQKLYLTPINNSSFEVHRRTDNGTAGSGVKYKVSYTSENAGDTIVLNFKPYESKSYQQGFVLQFPVPSFDIEQYLLQSSFEHSFEVNSDYSSESIKANFDRLLPKEKYGYKALHVIDSKSYKAFITVKIVPYRKGSKATTISNILIKSNNGNKVNLVNILNDLESRINSIVND